jgi:uncharacterized protein YutE (UPF0331/DUF86 family)
MRWIVTLPFLVPLLQAVEATEQEMQSIRTEAILFVVIFSVMSIVSIIVSKRQAKKYEKQKGLNKHEQPPQSEPTHADPLSSRLHELQQLVNEGVLTQEEFETLKRAKEMS